MNGPTPTPPSEEREVHPVLLGAVAGLATALVELRAASNPHYYFRAPTPVRRDDHVLDVGACEGGFALECLVRFGASTVWCFEPSPAMTRALRLTAARNGLADRMRVVEAAVSSSAGTIMRGVYRIFTGVSP